jgi:hypothetical protein
VHLLMVLGPIAEPHESVNTGCGCASDVTDRRDLAGHLLARLEVTVTHQLVPATHHRTNPAHYSTYPTHCFRHMAGWTFKVESENAEQAILCVPSG